MTLEVIQCTIAKIRTPKCIGEDWDIAWSEAKKYVRDFTGQDYPQDWDYQIECAAYGYEG